MDTELWEVLGAISGRLRTRYAQGGTPDLGFIALATLRHLARHGPCSVSDLAEAERVTSQAISLRIAPLLRSGMVARSPDPADGRRAVITITESGSAVVAAAAAHAQEALSGALRDLDRSERAALAAALPALTRIAAHLEKETP
jgi:DNA-binding MarR family transcriptional regulator